MEQWLKTQPLFVILLAVSSFLMYMPMIYSMRLEDWLYARTFFYHGTFFLILTSFLSIAFSSQHRSMKSVSHIFDLFCSFIIIPIFLAVPLDYLVPSIGMFEAYFEMLSSLTTTGASLFRDPNSLPDVLHLWRAIVGWAGGLLMLITAMGLFQPIGLGGFEVYDRAYDSGALQTKIRRADFRVRMGSYTASIFPIYAVLTVVMSLLLIINGDRPLVAVIHAMSTFSTSGISNVGGVSGSHSGVFGEIVIALFLIFAVSRFMYQHDSDGRGMRRLMRDKEVNLMLICVTLIPLLLFLRHWSSAIEISDQTDVLAAIGALWGGVFMVLSFLTTTGFESEYWATSRAWSGLGTTGLILMGLVVMGGGIATTAGGVKLLRVYALYKHGVREMQRLSFPSSVVGSGNAARKFRREGAYAAWIFFMLFLVSVAVVMLALSLTGIPFEDSLILAVSGLSTTGPLIYVAGEGGLDYATISTTAQGIFCVAMILGRLEALAVIAVLNPNFWLK
jgi:trk system potassium uptake protein TrkH